MIFTDAERDEVIAQAISEKTKIRVVDRAGTVFSGEVTGRLLSFPIIILNDGRRFEFSRQAIYNSIKYGRGLIL